MPLNQLTKTHLGFTVTEITSPSQFPCLFTSHFSWSYFIQISIIKKIINTVGFFYLEFT